jgi:uncharacterized SAM-binding protein YcdF (DUF218 family)
MEIIEIAKFFVNPLLYIFLGSILLIFRIKHRSKVCILLILYLYVISIPITGYLFNKIWKKDDTFNPQKVYAAAVVLAGVSNPDWHLDRDGLPYIPEDLFVANARTEKILAGIHFIKSGQAKLLLMGNAVYEKSERGTQKIYHERAFIRKIATEMGLKENQIIFYGDVKRTLDEATNLRLYQEHHPIRDFLFIANEIDMRRALAMLKKQGLHPDIFSVNKGNMEITWKSFVPQIDGIMSTQECFYEFVAYVGYYLKGDL